MKNITSDGISSAAMMIYPRILVAGQNAQNIFSRRASEGTKMFKVWKYLGVTPAVTPIEILIMVAQASYKFKLFKIVRNNNRMFDAKFEKPVSYGERRFSVVHFFRKRP